MPGSDRSSAGPSTAIDVSPRLSSGGFPLFFVGRVASVLGRQMLAVAVGWDLYERTRSFVVLGLVGLAQITPVVLLAVPAGHAVDRFDARRTGALSGVAMSMCAAGFSVSAYLHAPLPVFFLLLVLHGAATAFYAPSSSALLPRLITTEQRPRANAIMSTGFEVASVGGPALAGLLLFATGLAWPVYAFHAVTALVFVAALVLLRSRGVGAAVSASPARSLGEMAAGVRFVFGTPLLLSVMTLDLFAVLFGGVTALLPAFARDILVVGPGGLGALRAAPALGAATMAMISTRMKPWKHPGRALILAVSAFGLCTAAFAVSRSFSLSLVLLALAGAADNVSVVIRMTLEQMLTPDEMRGRVSAVRYVFVGLSNELGELESGLAAAAFGAVPSVLLGSAVCLAVVGVVGLGAPALVKLPPLAELKPAELQPAAAEGAGAAPPLHRRRGKANRPP